MAASRHCILEQAFGDGLRCPLHNARCFLAEQHLPKKGSIAPRFRPVACMACSVLDNENDDSFGLDDQSSDDMTAMLRGH